MPAARSPAQQAASRANGARSRGPVTDAGKARAARNGTRHGLRGGPFALLPGEDRTSSPSCTPAVTADWGPRDAFERRWVEELVAALGGRTGCAGWSWRPWRRRGGAAARRGDHEAPAHLRPLRRPDRQGHRPRAPAPCGPCATAPTPGSTNSGTHARTRGRCAANAKLHERTVSLHVRTRAGTANENFTNELPARTSEPDAPPLPSPPSPPRTATSAAGWRSWPGRRSGARRDDTLRAHRGVQAHRNRHIPRQSRAGPTNSCDQATSYGRRGKRRRGGGASTGSAHATCPVPPPPAPAPRRRHRPPARR